MPQKKKAVTKSNTGPERFTEVQKLLMIQWLAEGLTVNEINALAAKAKPPFIATGAELSYYRISRQIDVEEARRARESEIISTGFALRERRVEALNSLSMKIFQELSLKKGSKLWLSMVKGIGSGQDYERITYQEFNKAEVDTLRNLLDDIAIEVGGRIRRTDITTKDRPIGNKLDSRLWKDLSDDELAILERAAEILERGANKDSSTKK